MTITINGTTGIAGVDGSAATPAVQGGDANTGVFYGTDIVAISTGGTERVRVNASGQAEFTAGTAALPAITSTGDTNTGMFFPAADTIAFTEGGTEVMRLDSSANLQFNSGYGSVATAYGCRAWVNFNGTGTVAIRNSGNVTSITDNSAGNYTVNFTTAMPDINYSISAMAGSGNTSGNLFVSNYGGAGVTTTTVRIVSWIGHTAVQADTDTMTVSIFR